MRALAALLALALAGEAAAQGARGRVAPEAAAPSAPAEPLTEAERAAFRAAVVPCWLPPPLPLGSREASVTLSFDLDGAARPDPDSFEIERHAAPDTVAAVEQFVAARRAVLRCGREGYPLPPEKRAAWSRVVMTFDADGSAR